MNPYRHENPLKKASTRSLQKTLSIGLTLGVALLWIVALTGVVYISQNKLNQLFDSALAETAQRIMPLAVVEILNREDSQQPQQIMAFEAHDERLTYIVRDKNGVILMRSHNATPASFSTSLQKGFSSSDTYRFYGASAIQNTLFIDVAEPLKQRQEAIIEVLIALVWPLIILIPLCLFGTWAFVRYSMRHIQSYCLAIESRGKGDLSPIRVDDLPIELRTITQSVNSLLNRLERALESERSFTANSAHELRTPIATGLAQVQRLQQEILSDPIRDRIDKLELTLKNLAVLSEKLMQLAKAEGGGLFTTKEYNLIALLKMLIEDFQRGSPNTELVLNLPKDGVFMGIIDQDAFAILIRNLLDNASKYGIKNKPIKINFSSNGVLSVSNACSIIPAEKLLQLKKRFIRSNSLTQGLGLGLAIVDTIVSGVGSTMMLNSPAYNEKEGFEVIIDFSSIRMN